MSEKSKRTIFSDSNFFIKGDSFPTVLEDAHFRGCVFRFVPDDSELTEGSVISEQTEIK